MAIAIEKAFNFCPQCGHPKDRPGKIPFRCDTCEMALYLGPVAAVAALISDEQNRLLLVRRARDPGKGMWGIPGGFVDRNETIEDALVREVFEETKLVVNDQHLLMTHPNNYAYAGILVPVIDMFYVCKVKSLVDIRLADDELESYQWTNPTIDHLSNMAFESNRIAIERWMSSVN